MACLFSAAALRLFISWQGEYHAILDDMAWLKGTLAQLRICLN